MSEYSQSTITSDHEIDANSLCLVSLKCSMDVQSSDGRSLLLKYVSSYVTKMKDHKLLKGLIHSISSLHLYHVLT